VALEKTVEDPKNQAKAKVSEIQEEKV